MVGFSAVGSLKEEVKPRDFIVVDQLVDWTRGVSFTWLDKARVKTGGSKFDPDIKAGRGLIYI